MDLSNKSYPVPRERLVGTYHFWTDDPEGDIPVGVLEWMMRWQDVPFDMGPV
jgi:hypothetical protein